MPCKPRMTGCRRDCGHRQVVQEYRAARAAEEAAQEAACLGYGTEEKLYGPLLTFRRYIEQRAS